MPLCNYTSWYTVTLYEKLVPDSSDVPFFIGDEYQMFGTPSLVTIDLENDLILIDASDRDLSDRIFQVVVNCHINVNSTV